MSESFRFPAVENHNPLNVESSKTVVKTIRREKNEASLDRASMARSSKEKMTRKTTLSEIARKAGVSTATVSRSLGNSHLIHPETRVRILNLAIQSGYKGRSGYVSRARQGGVKLGILIDERQNASTPASVLFLQGVALEAEKNNLLLRIEKWIAPCPKGKGASRELPRLVKNRLIDILILQGEYRHEEIRALSQQMPLVSFQQKCDGGSIDVVESENGQAFRRIIAHLVARGHRHIAWVGASRNDAYSRDRAAGFFLGCLDGGLPWSMDNFLCASPLDADAGALRLALGAAFRRGITAFVCVSDSIAEEVSLQLSSLGLKIPDDVSLVGYGAEKLQLGDGKRLTSFNPGFVELGCMAVRVALQRLAHPLAPPLTQRGGGQIQVGQTIKTI